MYPTTYGYNNMAIGMYAGNSGNALYCPTGYLELLRLQDRLVYLPEMPYRKVDWIARRAMCWRRINSRQTAARRQRRELAEHGCGSQRTPQHDGCLPHEQPLRRGCRFEALRPTARTAELTQVADDLWALTDEAGQAVTELTDGTLLRGARHRRRRRGRST